MMRMYKSQKRNSDLKLLLTIFKNRSLSTIIELPYINNKEVNENKKMKRILQIKRNQGEIFQLSSVLIVANWDIMQVNVLINLKKKQNTMLNRSNINILPGRKHQLM
jgi:hypothetical protein